MKFDLLTQDYRDQLVKKHDAKPWGGGGKSWATTVAVLVNGLDEGDVILDYGCGRGTFKPAMLELRPDLVVEEYDPGVRGKDKTPTIPVNYVVCTDVMEHIEEEKVDGVLGHLDWLAKDGIFFNIVFTPSRSFLPDGRNTHITCKSYEWWKAKFTEERFPAMEWTYLELNKHRWVFHGQRDWGIYRDV